MLIRATQPSNALSPIEVTSDGESNVTLARSVEFLNAPVPIVLVSTGNVIAVILEPKNA